MRQGYITEGASQILCGTALGCHHSPTHCGGWLPLLHCPACRHSVLDSSPGCSWKPWLHWYTAFVPTVYSLPKTTPFFGALGTPQERAGKEEGKKTAEKSVSFQYDHGFVISELKPQLQSSPICKSSSTPLNPRSCNECPLSQRIRFSPPLHHCGNSKANTEY